MLILIFCAAFLLPNFVISFPSGDDLFVSDSAAADTIKKNEGPMYNTPILKQMLITSNIQNRYARTIVLTKYLNAKDEAQEATFLFVLPQQAFITEFIMEIKEKQYKAYVRETEEAKNEYNAAVTNKLSAAYVEASPRDSNTFKVSMNIEAQNKVIFNLTYEEFLEKKDGKYLEIINVYPGQLVEDFSIEININETKPIIDLNILAMQTDNDINHDLQSYEFLTISDLNFEGTEKQIRFAPTISQQKELIKQNMETNPYNGISGQFLVEYNVEPDSNGGEIITEDGYFVHFFSPSGLEVIPKHVIFVLDVSGSMSGTKIEQLKEAMKVIIGEINDDDYFSIVKFHTTVQVLNSDGWIWSQASEEPFLPKPIPASIYNLYNAQNKIANLKVEDLTNINGALQVALNLANLGQKIKIGDKQKQLKPIIIFLTDGDANVGEQDTNKIIDLTTSKNNNNIKPASIFTLSFSHKRNFELLVNLAKMNSGFMRYIYGTADASLQLKNFYKEISSVLLSNVTFQYANDQLFEVTNHNYSNTLFKGSELVIAGKIGSNISEKILSVEGIDKTGQRIFHPTLKPIIRKNDTTTTTSRCEYGSLERVWVYLTIKNLLNEDTSTSRKRALDLSLKYSFVTPLTSLIVVKPNKTELVDIVEYNKETDKTIVSVKRNKVYLPKKKRPITTTPRNVQPRYFNPFVLHTSFMRSSDLLMSKDVVENHFEIIEEPIILPSWMNYPDNEKVILNNTIYFIGNSNTTYELKPCKVQNENKIGECTLLIHCRQVYGKLTSYETYMNNYLCPLNMGSRINLLSVCCI